MISDANTELYNFYGIGNVA